MVNGNNTSSTKDHIRELVKEDLAQGNTSLGKDGEKYIEDALELIHPHNGYKSVFPSLNAVDEKGNELFTGEQCRSAFRNNASTFKSRYPEFSNGTTAVVAKRGALPVSNGYNSTMNTMLGLMNLNLNGMDQYLLANNPNCMPIGINPVTSGPNITGPINTLNTGPVTTYNISGSAIDIDTFMKEAGNNQAQSSGIDKDTTQQLLSAMGKLQEQSKETLVVVQASHTVMTTGKGKPPASVAEKRRADLPSTSLEDLYDNCDSSSAHAHMPGTPVNGGRDSSPMLPGSHGSDSIKSCTKAVKTEETPREARSVFHFEGLYGTSPQAEGDQTSAKFPEQPQLKTEYSSATLPSPNKSTTEMQSSPRTYSKKDVDKLADAASVKDCIITHGENNTQLFAEELTTNILMQVLNFSITHKFAGRIRFLNPIDLTSISCLLKFVENLNPNGGFPASLFGELTEEMAKAGLDSCVEIVREVALKKIFVSVEACKAWIKDIHTRLGLTVEGSVELDLDGPTHSFTLTLKSPFRSDSSTGVPVPDAVNNGAAQAYVQSATSGSNTSIHHTDTSAYVPTTNTPGFVQPSSPTLPNREQLLPSLSTSDISVFGSSGSEEEEDYSDKAAPPASSSFPVKSSETALSISLELANAAKNSVNIEAFKKKVGSAVHVHEDAEYKATSKKLVVSEDPQRKTQWAELCNDGNGGPVRISDGCIGHWNSGKNAVVTIKLLPGVRYTVTLIAKTGRVAVQAPKLACADIISEAKKSPFETVESYIFHFDEADDETSFVENLITEAEIKNALITLESKRDKVE